MFFSAADFLRAFLPPAETRTSRATDRGRRSEHAAADIAR